MADAALFEFLHTEMVAELWAHHSDPGPGVSAGSRGGEEARAAPGRPGRGPGERGARRAGQRSRVELRPHPCLARCWSLLCEVGIAAGPASRVTAKSERGSSG